MGQDGLRAFSTVGNPAAPSANGHASRLLEFVHDLMFSLPADRKRLLYLNPAGETIYGRSSAELTEVDNLWIECVHADDRIKGAGRMLGQRAGRMLGQPSCERKTGDSGAVWLSIRSEIHKPPA